MTALHDKYDHYPSLRLYDRLSVPYILTSERWAGPLWTGHCMILSTTDGYGDEGFAHELFHWIVASPRQRTMPDFALGRQVNASTIEFATSTSEHLYDSRRRHKRQPTSRNDGWGETTVALSTATRQEVAACNAMWLYFPLTGQLGWDDPTYSTTAGDFAGFEYPGSPQWRTANVTKRVMPIIEALDPSITRDMVADYLIALHVNEKFQRTY